MFTVAGPVIVYGTSASAIYGIILVLLRKRLIIHRLARSM